MPNLKAHCAISKQRTNRDYKELHRWIDEFHDELGINHRKKRHAYTHKDEEYVKKKWGEKGVVEWLFHIAIDNLHTAFKYSRSCYGANTYNLIEIGITDSEYVHVDFTRLNSWQMKKYFE